MSHRIRSNKKGGAKPGSIRIIAGQWRGRKLPVHELEGLRPTTDRVKETLFNWLNPHLPGATCLDLFAGSGSLGFEALSRGAASVTMVERDKNVAAQLEANLSLLNCGAGLVVNGTAEHYLQGSATAYDLVFIDPPFRQGLLEPVCRQLVEGGWLRDGALLYLERERESEAVTLPAEFSLLKSKQAGQVLFELYQFDSCA